MARPNLRPGRSCKTMDETMAVVDEPGTRVPRLYRRWECVNLHIFCLLFQLQRNWGKMIFEFQNGERIICRIIISWRSL